MSAVPRWDDAPTLVDLLLAEQQDLTAVDTFAALHEEGETAGNRYEALIPTSLPDADRGEQYAFRVDLDACTGCKACVTACHSLNGLEEGETWRKVGLIETNSYSEPMSVVRQQTVTTACHHCADPACLSGCPVVAYEKDPETGIVRHLDDQCIGCRYCQLMCPYDVPTYSERLGIVRKCDLCRGRLAEGEAPACVQGCPNEAIQIAIVSTDAHPSESAGSGSSASASAGNMLLPLSNGAMPDSKWTRPTTVYVSNRDPSGTASVPRGEPTDLHRVAPSEGHLPLAVMLVLTQAAIGTFLLNALLGWVPGGVGRAERVDFALVALATTMGFAGLLASTLHLGRPQWAFRAFLGLRTSWMSREIVVFGAFAGLIAATSGSAALAFFMAPGSAGDLGSVGDLLVAFASLRPWLGGAAAAVGLLGLYCSVQIYAVTGRPLWRFDRTAMRFGTTALVMGLALMNLVYSTSGVIGISLACLVLLLGLGELRRVQERDRLYATDREEEVVAIRRTRMLLEGALRVDEERRQKLLSISFRLLPVIQLALIAIGASPVLQTLVAGSIFVSSLTGEFLERSLFFRAEAMPSMPGVG
jgi:Fe-S-cluster-containing dehydrogenase component/DMSO reductase anchor subunit